MAGCPQIMLPSFEERQGRPCPPSQGAHSSTWGPARPPGLGSWLLWWGFVLLSSLRWLSKMLDVKSGLMLLRLCLCPTALVLMCLLVCQRLARCTHSIQSRLSRVWSVVPTRRGRDPKASRGLMTLECKYEKVVYFQGKPASWGFTLSGEMKS